MKPSTLLALPLSLLLHIVNAQELEGSWHQHRDEIDGALEQETGLGRDLEVQQKLARQSPVRVRKMSEDEGEMFFLHYWAFEDSSSSDNLSVASAPIVLHTIHDRPLALLGRSLFSRDSQCPANTESCSVIDSSLCCPSGQTCVATKSGVGCCASADGCDTVAGCDTNAGYTSCPDTYSGGCCVPGSTCKGGSVCVIAGTSTVVLTLSPSTVTAGMTTVTGSSGTTTYVLPPSTIAGYMTTVTVTQSISGQVSTVTQPTTVVIAGSLTSTTSSSVSATASAPVIPNSISSSDSAVSAAAQVTTTTTITPSTSDETCPTGFYMCSAYYIGGCCRVGRNCDTTSCLATDSTAIVSSGPTVVVAATATASQGSCANGWSLCGSDAGGGCCPRGYLCGTSCTATVSGESNTGKEAPSSASVVGAVWSLVAMGVLAGVGMVML